MAHVEELLEALREYVNEDLPHYTDALRAAFRETDPVFTRPRYAQFFWHCASRVPGWLAQVVLANAQAESEGSARLMGLWQTVDYNREVERQVLIHAWDESRHSRLFLDLTGLAFPQQVDRDLLLHLSRVLPDVRREKPQKGGGRTPEDLLIDHLVQMNIGEIRTRIHVMLLAPVIHAFAPEEARPRVRQILQGLVADEIRHIGYTARLMERWAQAGAAARVARLYRERLRDFHAITIQQTEAAVHAYGQGRYPDLLEI